MECRGRGKLKVTERETEESQHGNKRGEQKCFCKSSCGEVGENTGRLSGNYCLILLHSKKGSYVCLSLHCLIAPRILRLKASAAHIRQTRTKQFLIF